MSEAVARVERRLKTAGWLLIAGLLTQAATLYWTVPLSFLLFIGVGALLVGAGVLLFLKTIMTL